MVRQPHVLAGRPAGAARRRQPDPLLRQRRSRSPPAALGVRVGARTAAAEPAPRSARRPLDRRCTKLTPAPPRSPRQAGHSAWSTSSGRPWARSPCGSSCAPTTSIRRGSSTSSRSCSTERRPTGAATRPTEVGRSDRAPAERTHAGEDSGLAELAGIRAPPDRARPARARPRGLRPGRTCAAPSPPVLPELLQRHSRRRLAGDARAGARGAHTGLAGATASWESQSVWIRGRARYWPYQLPRLRGSRRDYPRFPNPHIRTTAFIDRPREPLAMKLEDARDKRDTYLLESGRRSITRQILRAGAARGRRRPRRARLRGQGLGRLAHVPQRRAGQPARRRPSHRGLASAPRRVCAGDSRATPGASTTWEAAQAKGSAGRVSGCAGGLAQDGSSCLQCDGLGSRRPPCAASATPTARSRSRSPLPAGAGGAACPRPRASPATRPRSACVSWQIARSPATTAASVSSARAPGTAAQHAVAAQQVAPAEPRQAALAGGALAVRARAQVHAARVLALAVVPSRPCAAAAPGRGSPCRPRSSRPARRPAPMRLRR